MIRSRHSAAVPSSDPALAGLAEQRAIIDIGSNTVRMVIYGGPKRAPAVLFNEKVTARLGRGVAESGKLSAKGMATALGALARFAKLLELRGVRDVDTVATAAARDARNGGEFLEQVAALGLSPRLLSGEEEAETSAHGVLAAFPGAAGIVGDLGGGSLELIDIADGRSTHGVSLPLGTLRLAALRAEGPDKFTRKIHKMLADTDWAAHSGQTLYLVGGSLRALARYAMVQRDWPVDDPHGFEMRPEEAVKIARSLAARGRDMVLPHITGVSSSRLGTLPDAAALLGVLVRELKPSRVIFSGWGLREGVLAQTMTPDVAAQDPLLAGVSAFVDGQQSGFAQAAGRLAAWTAPLASGISTADEILRRASTMLALATLRNEPNLRVELAVQWALRKRWIGLDTRGRAMLAMAVLANGGQVTMPPSLLRLASEADLRMAAGWGLATRLARRFSGGAADVFEQSGLTIKPSGAMPDLVLSLAENLRDLYNDVTAKDLRNLGEWLGLEPQKPVFTG